MKLLLARLVDLLYPRECTNCARVGASWCEHCYTALSAATFATGERILDDGLRVVYGGKHEGLLRNAVHAFKFEDAQFLGEPLGTVLSEALQLGPTHFDLAVPVPLHSKRHAWRGYNQAELLVQAIEVVRRIPCADALERIRHTGTQVGRDATERRRAVQGAFVAEDSVRDLNILLVDDVVTTGSTLMACAEALYAAGAASVTAACVASA